jgi:predicted MPP superfamily phosphohydrolase
METTGCRIVTYPHKDQEFKIYDMADFHLLNAGCAVDHLREDISSISKEENALVNIVGDYADWLNPNDPRWDAEMVDEEVTVRNLTKLTAKITSVVLRELKPLASKCMGLGMGNHEWQYMRRRSEMQVHEFICSELGVPNLRYSAWMNVFFVYNPRQKCITLKYSDEAPMRYENHLKIMTHHGKGAANTVGGKINSLRDIVELAHDSDIVQTGHLHESTIKPFVRLTTDFLCSKLKNKITFGMATGSYLRNYVPGVTSWGETRGFRLTTLGCVYVTYSPRRHTINDIEL